MRTKGDRGSTRASITHLAVSAVFLISVSACQNQPVAQDLPNPAVVERDAQAFTHAWQAYADEVNEVPRQAACEPTLIPAATTLPRLGAVVMVHGFGGCPQQFLELGARVAERGFDVLLPLLPGHGVLPTADGDDDLSRLPIAKDGVSRYGGLARRMNDIMARSPGERVIVGFSLGGAISVNANLQARELYDRQLLISPMFAIRGGAFLEGLVNVLGRVPAIKNLIVKPKAARKLCDEWQSAGRAGFCDYRLKHTVALLALDDMNEEQYAQQAFNEPVQIVAAGDEQYISNDEIVSFVEQHQSNGPISLCFMPADVPHEMLSPYENAGTEMYWLQGLLENAVGFIVDKQDFPMVTDPEQDSRPDCSQSAV
jgi:alpha-beta hydrolase superfamily lysophospholipase